MLLQSLWKIPPSCIIILVGKGYFITKLPSQETLDVLLLKGPWFVNGTYLCVQ